MQQFYSRVSHLYFVAATVILMLLALLLLISAVWDAVANLLEGNRVDAALHSIGLLIIGFAVIETAKFIAEEEIIRKRELRSSTESRRSITKFITIIVIAASLEALVMVFQTSRRGIEFAIYPAMLFMSAMFALVALGVYQYLSSRIEPPKADDRREQEEVEGESL
jgi:uncharacterized membrane protein